MGARLQPLALLRAYNISAGRALEASPGTMLCGGAQAIGAELGQGPKGGNLSLLQTSAPRSREMSETES